MNTWTIIATLITGAVFGIALMCGIIYLALRMDEQEKIALQKATRRKSLDDELRQHYESTIHDH